MIAFIAALCIGQEVRGNATVAPDKSEVTTFHNVRLGRRASRYDVVVVNQAHSPTIYRWVDVYRLQDGKRVRVSRYETNEKDDDSPQFGNLPDGTGLLSLGGIWKNEEFGEGILLFDPITLKGHLVFWDPGDASISLKRIANGYVVESKEFDGENGGSTSDDREMNRKLVHNPKSLTLIAGKPTREPLDPPEKETLTGRRGKHRYRIEVVTQAFSMKRHKSIRYTADHQVDLIDGQVPLGTDGAIPVSEFLSFRVWLDNVEIHIPRQKWQPFYDFSLSGRTGRLSSDGSHLHLETGESDGAGSYVVIWDFYKSGRYRIDTPDPETYFSTHP